MTVYARLVDGAVVEYPVYEEHIEARNHPVSWYTEVVFGTVPTIPEFYTTEEVLTVKDGKVYVTYNLIALTLEQLFNQVPRSAETAQPGDVVSDATLSEALMNRIADLVVERVQERLDAFASTRNYGDGKTASMVAACSYINSTIPKFAAEGQYCIEVRDLTWTTLYTYFDGIKAGTTAIPHTYEEVEALLPVLTWPEVV